MRPTGIPSQRSAVAWGRRDCRGVTTVTCCPIRRRWSANVRSCDSAPPPPCGRKSLSKTMSTRNRRAVAAAAAPGVTAAGATALSTPIDVSPQPVLQHVEPPDRVGVIPAAAFVLGQQPLDERRVPPAAGARAIVEQRLAHGPLKGGIAAQPHGDRKTEALLLLAQDLLGKDTRHGALEEVALLEPAHLLPLGQAVDVGQESGVEVGEADGHTDGLGRAVDL